MVGCGPVGLLLVQLARLAGAGKIVAIDPVEARTALACDLGADVACRSHEEVADATEGRGADLVIEATDSSARFRHAARCARIGGRLVIVGIPENNRVFSQRRRIAPQGPVDQVLAADAGSLPARDRAGAERSRQTCAAGDASVFTGAGAGRLRAAGRTPRRHHQGDHLSLGQRFAKAAQISGGKSRHAGAVGRHNRTARPRSCRRSRAASSAARIGANLISPWPGPRRFGSLTCTCAISPVGSQRSIRCGNRLGFGLAGGAAIDHGSEIRDDRSRAPARPLRRSC